MHVGLFRWSVIGYFDSVLLLNQTTPDIHCSLLVVRHLLFRRASALWPLVFVCGPSVAFTLPNAQIGYFKLQASPIRFYPELSSAVINHGSNNDSKSEKDPVVYSPAAILRRPSPQDIVTG